MGTMSCSMRRCDEEKGKQGNSLILRGGSILIFFWLNMSLTRGTRDELVWIMWDVAAVQQGCSNSSVLEAAIIFLRIRMLLDLISSSADQFLDSRFSCGERHSGGLHNLFHHLWISCSGEFVEVGVGVCVYVLVCSCFSVFSVILLLPLPALSDSHIFSTCTAHSQQASK